MATGDNAVVALFERAEEITGYCVAAVRGGRFLKVAQDIPGGVDSWKGTENIQVRECVAGENAIAVSRYECQIAEQVPLIMDNLVIPMVCGAAIAANAQVQSDANALPITLASGVSLGTAVNATENAGEIVLVKLKF